MKRKELQDMLSHYVNPRSLDDEVVIKVTLPYTTVGGTPYVKVTGVNSGFDWDAGKLFLLPESPLTLSDAEFKEQMTKMQSDLGWAQLEIRNLKAEIKRLKENKS